MDNFDENTPNTENSHPLQENNANEAASPESVSEQTLHENTPNETASPEVFTSQPNIGQPNFEPSGFEQPNYGQNIGQPTASQPQYRQIPPQNQGAAQPYCLLALFALLGLSPSSAPCPMTKKTRRGARFFIAKR